MKFLTKILRGTFILFIGSIGSRTFMMIYRYLAMKNLSIEQYGILALALSFVNAVLPFAHLSISGCISKYISSSKTSLERKEYVLSALLINIIMATLVSFIILYFFHRNRIAVKYIFFSIIMGLYTLDITLIFSGYLIGTFRMKYASLLNIFNSLVSYKYYECYR